MTDGKATSVATGSLDARSRREYWSAQLDAAWRFMRQAVDVPLVDTCEGAIDLAAMAPSSLDISFATASDGPNTAGMFYLRESLAPHLFAVVRELNAMGLSLRVEYGYRTPQMQEQLCTSNEVLNRVITTTTWETGGTRPEPELVYRRLVVLCANVYKNGTHLGASAVDVSIIERDTGERLDLGGPYLTLSELTPMDSPHTAPLPRRNRALIRGTFARHGFVAYPFEFWHFSAGDVFEPLLGGARQEARFGPVLLDPATGSVTPVANPEREIVPKAQMLARIEAMLDERLLDV
jgi:D-alanyl-D-alanine dipeptidase